MNDRELAEKLGIEKARLQQVDVPHKFLTTPEAVEAYTYIPEDVELPDLYDTEDVPAEEKCVVVKLFLPSTPWTWLITESSSENPDICFGYVVSGFGPGFNEWGYINLAELREARNKQGLPIERDIHFKPMKFADLQKQDVN